MSSGTGRNVWGDLEVLLKVIRRELANKLN